MLGLVGQNSPGKDILAEQFLPQSSMDWESHTPVPKVNRFINQVIIIGFYFPWHRTLDFLKIQLRKVLCRSKRSTISETLVYHREISVVPFPEYLSHDSLKGQRQSPVISMKVIIHAKDNICPLIHDVLMQIRQEILPGICTMLAMTAKMIFLPACCPIGFPMSRWRGHGLFRIIHMRIPRTVISITITQKIIMAVIKAQHRQRFSDFPEAHFL